MIIIPAVDIKNGKCVRLFQGEADKETIYAENPCDFAVKWEEEGASFLHIVDLDGAFSGQTVNLPVIENILKNTNNIKIEIGGGIRSLETIEKYLNAGAERVILGTKATDEKFLTEAVKNFDDKIIVGIDAKDGYVTTDGWVKKTDIKGIDFVKQMASFGVKRIIYTDITYDGTLKGPNLEGMREVVENTDIAVIASGGVSKLEDIKNLNAINKSNLEGVIVGKALYTKDLDLKEAIKCLQNA